ncbi:response regulator transcription factor [Shewanella intestini]|uniref:Response regulator transcription factor n=1 Tax=Shewanella intestini TaxID=2017544 RepID=A0ABS5I1P5_9GAMM|nr:MULTISPECIES: response regulator transcription factor [Shewanella]MBR9727927.1 response regulator transcription factor [Shewanella intestini]
MNTEKISLALIEDDIRLAHVIEKFLIENGFLIKKFYSAEAFVNSHQQDSFNIILSDINLPGESGYDLLNFIKDRISIPFIFLTAKTNDEDQIKGLQYGACDYISKPVRPKILLARIHNALRSASSVKSTPDPQQEIVLNDCYMNITERRVEICNTNVEFTTEEFELFKILMENNGKILDREYLFKEVVGRDYNGEDRIVDGRVSRIRKKLNLIPNNTYQIKTIWRKGYLFTNT